MPQKPPPKNLDFLSRPLIQTSRRSFLKLAAIATSSATVTGLISHADSLATPAEPSTRSAIRMGVISLSFYQVVGGLIQNILEAQGYAVEIIQGSHAEIYPVLGQGELDMLVAVWLPTGHGPLFAQYGASTMELGSLYDDALFFWGVPDYLPDDVRSIADLARPEISPLMIKQIQSIGSGAGITRLSQSVMTRYNLQAAGYRFQAGTEQEWIDAYERGVSAERGVIIPLWQPQYLNRAYAIRRLNDPLGVFPSPDRCSLVVTKDFPDRFPSSLVETLRRVRLDVASVTEMDYLTQMENLSPREAATRWMTANPDRVQSWST
ncbi:twin-arginine translocation signal domain-containing protein [Oscillatoria sp. FACHB-1407]|uniref:glycine betaine ABC transporter substrate-binding protein n=1 Tax=Oscillatoria sp. FACHB-1407 TaxID=2692847 RepID=UPI00168264A2|nr:glycine betaine ABC transporter substrate-binding protein [Oscillatoria sp. FACHB-1407]MBD2463076.1 twin-arginine translocation signal domain-containing protein [Oscillatoria sp. FACHB-1407]